MKKYLILPAFMLLAPMALHAQDITEEPEPTPAERSADGLIRNSFGIEIAYYDIAEDKRADTSSCGGTNFRVIGQSAASCWPELQALRAIRTAMVILTEQMDAREGDVTLWQEKLDTLGTLAAQYETREWPAYDAALSFIYTTTAYVQAQQGDRKGAMAQVDKIETLFADSKLDKPSIIVSELDDLRRDFGKLADANMEKDK